MPTPIENLKRNDWVAIVSYKTAIAECKHAIPVFHGRPFRIEEISLPFVAVENIFGRYEALDVRLYALQKLKLRYARVMRLAHFASKLDGLSPNEQNAVDAIMKPSKT